MFGTNSSGLYNTSAASKINKFGSSGANKDPYASLNFGSSTAKSGGLNDDPYSSIQIGGEDKNKSFSFPFDDDDDFENALKTGKLSNKNKSN